MTTTLQVGATASVEVVVTAADTATALGSGDVPVLGTPRVLALLERAAVAAVAGALPAGATSVGAHVELDHLRPSRIGSTVVARATLARVDGRRLDFEVELTDAGTVVASGKVTRVVVDRDRFAPG
jgi:fluoroacetyl-CoA thioesterase